MGEAYIIFQACLNLKKNRQLTGGGKSII